MFVVQSVLLDKSVYRTRADASRWVSLHSYKKNIHPDPNPESLNLWRFRQRQPSQFIQGTFRYIEHKDKGVAFVVGKLKQRFT